MLYEVITFLVTGNGWRAAAERSEEMAQGYLNDQEAVTSGRDKRPLCPGRRRNQDTVPYRKTYRLQQPPRWGGKNNA